MKNKKLISKIVLSLAVSCLLGACSKGNSAPRTIIEGKAESIVTSKGCSVDANTSEAVCKFSGELPEDFTCFLGGENGVPVECSLNDEGKLVLTLPQNNVLADRDLDVCVKAGAEDCQIVGKVRIEREEAEDPAPEEDGATAPQLCQQTGCPEGFICGEDGVCVVDPNPPAPPPPPAPNCHDGGLVCPDGQECGEDGQCHEVAPPAPERECVVDADCHADSYCSAAGECFLRQIQLPQRDERTERLREQMREHQCPGGVFRLNGPCPDPLRSPSRLKVSFVKEGPNKSELTGKDGHRTRDGQDIVLGTTRIHWKVEGTDPKRDLKELYIYGNFNGGQGDACGGPLVVRESGLAVENNSGLAQQDDYRHYLRGQRCQNNNNCSGYELFSPILTGRICRIDLKPLLDEGIGGDPVTEHTFHTISRQPIGLYFLIGITQDDKIKMDVFRVDAPRPEITFSTVRFNGSGKVQIDMNYKNAFSRYIFNSRQMSGDGSCHSIGDVQPVPPNGHGAYSVECDIKSSNHYYLQVQGLSSNVEEAYRLGCDEPRLLLLKGAFNPAAQGATQETSPGELTLTGIASRQCRLYKGNDEVDHKQVSGGISALRIVAYPPRGPNTHDDNPQAPTCGTSIVARPSEEVSGMRVENDNISFIATLPANHNCTRYEFRVRDDQNRLVTTNKNETFIEYTPKFEIISQSSEWQYTYGYDHCGWSEACSDGDCCHPRSDRGEYFTGDDGGCGCRHDSDDGVSNCRNYKIKLRVGWKAQHVNVIQVYCTGLGEDGGHHRSFRINTENENYGLQTSGNRPSTVEMDGEAADCKFSIVTYNGSLIRDSRDLKESRNNEWVVRQERGEGLCDGRDIDGNDHNDTGFDTWD